MSKSTDTPAMQQYKRFKQAHPGCVLFFRLGDFYEMFFEDAVIVSKVLGITLTQRTKGVPMAGMPHHSAEGYISRMIHAGYRVAVAEQVEDASQAKGLVQREVTRVITPGTLTDASLLEDARENPLLAIHPCGDETALAFAELSTGDFQIVRVPTDELADELARIQPSEILFADSDGHGDTPDWLQQICGERYAVTPRPGWQFRAADASETLRRQYAVSDLTGLGFDDNDPCIPAAGAVLFYLLETQRSNEEGRLEHLSIPRPLIRDQFLMLDQTTLASLEVVQTLRGGQTDGSLLGIFRGAFGAVTAMGKRQLRRWLCRPLRDKASIEARQQAVALLVEDDNLRETLRERLGQIQDLERITARLAVGRITPRDLVALGHSGTEINALDHLLEPHPQLAVVKDALSAHLLAINALSDELVTTCKDEAPPHLREGGLIRDGVDADLDEARQLQNDSHAWLAQYQADICAETGLEKLKVGYNKVFGYFIELTKANSSKAPPSWHRKQTLVNAERYITDELKVFEGKVLSAGSRAIAREQELFATLCDKARQHTHALQTAARSIADLDCLHAFAARARRFGYVRPVLSDSPVLDIKQARHPVLDDSLGDAFVANDTRLTCEDQPASLALITGPNMAGKSTYIRQTALIAILAHTGGFVPAAHATIGLADRIFSRVGAHDELHAGRSTFMVEMSETANICHHATEHSIVVLDEIGRGTSTLDGLSLAWAIAEHMAHLQCRCLFATHYHEITQLADQMRAVTNLSVSVREWKDDIVFLHRIISGATDQSYGIHVAKIAGLPASVLKRARELLAQLEVSHEGKAPQLPDAPAKTTKETSAQATMPLFCEPPEPHPAVEILQQVDLMQLTPLAAFDLIRELKTTIKP